MIVVDVAEGKGGARAFLLAQSYMPAQQLHVLVNPREGAPGPWYVDRRGEALKTPEWFFDTGSLRRFTANGCPKRFH